MRRCPGNKRRNRLIQLALLSILSLPDAFAGDRLAEAFGQLPQMWGARLSPNGEYVSFLHMDKELDAPVGLVVSAETGETNTIIASSKGLFDLRWCEWANSDRLLCGFVGIDKVWGSRFGTTRLAAVDRDGANLLVLLQNALKRGWGLSQIQDNVIDWLPDDPEHVLINMPDAEVVAGNQPSVRILGSGGDRGTGVSRLNIYDGSMQTVYRIHTNVRDWLSDGRGDVRARYAISLKKRRWDVRLAGGDDWETLFEASTQDFDSEFWPVGFGAQADELLFFARHDGRRALFSRRLPDGNDELLFSHDSVDVTRMCSLGPFDRLVGVSYTTDRTQHHYFEPDIARLANKLRDALGGKEVSIVDESQDRRFYLVHVSSDQDAGYYYRYDTQTGSLKRFWPKHPTLAGIALSPMLAIEVEARDGESIPAYLTLPVNAAADVAVPLIVLPHGGPESRDVWGYDWLVQFFAARGFGVLQVNYRGSGGYGDDWVGDGGFRSWRQAVADITDGVQQLITDGTVDADRICIVGWSYGGYAALMSSVEEPHVYRCAVSIAGVADPFSLMQDFSTFLNRKAMQEYIGYDEEVIKSGSPLRRADEIRVPVMLFHGDEDLNVSVQHSKKMHKALKKRGLSSLRIYKDAEHSIWSNRYRVDMLTRIGAFVDENTADAGG